MSPIDMKHPLTLLAFVAVVSISSASALFGRGDKLDATNFNRLPYSEDWSPEKLMFDFSKGYQPRYADYYEKEYGLGDEIAGTAYSWLSRTGEKSKPATIFNKYSVQDLLDLNLVYLKKATLEELDRRKQMCEELSPGKVNEKEWRQESRFTQSAEAKLLNQKYFLSEYCWSTFSRFKSRFVRNLDRQVERKLAKEDVNAFNTFRESLYKYCRQNIDNREFEQKLKDHIMAYDKDELAKLRASCLKLDPLAATYRLGEFGLSFYSNIFDYCKQIKTV